LHAPLSVALQIDSAQALQTLPSLSALTISNGNATTHCSLFLNFSATFFPPTRPNLEEAVDLVPFMERVNLQSLPMDGMRK
jgi:hypothetical protein